MGLEAESKPEAQKPRLSYEDGLKKTEQLINERNKVVEALTNAEKDTGSSLEAKQKAYEWREKYLHFKKNELPDLLYPVISPTGNEKMTVELELYDKDILTRVFDLQKSLDRKGAR